MAKVKQTITDAQQFWLDHVKAADASNGSRVAYAAGKPEISGPLTLLGIWVVDLCIQPTAVRTSPATFHPAIRVV